MRTTRARPFILLQDSTIEPRATIGTIVFDCLKYDYGLASDDTEMTGVKHVSVTLDPEGGYPSFTIPISALSAIDAKRDQTGAWEWLDAQAK